MYIPNALRHILTKRERERERGEIQLPFIQKHLDAKMKMIQLEF